MSPRGRRILAHKRERAQWSQLRVSAKFWALTVRINRIARAMMDDTDFTIVG